MIENRIRIADIGWSLSGDLVIKNGDLYDTSKKVGEGFHQEVIDRIKSSTRDWKLYRNRGADIENFYGMINNSSTWSLIEGAIDHSLTKDGFLDRRDFIISIAPISNTSIAIRIDFDTSLTNTVPNSTITIKIAFDLTGQQSFIFR